MIQKLNKNGKIMIFMDLIQTIHYFKISASVFLNHQFLKQLFTVLLINFMFLCLYVTRFVSSINFNVIV